jgi:2-keto-3-deoxy-6-phosphogluconate aldolase
MNEYLSISEVFAIGRSWLASKAQITNKDWSAITAQVKKALSKAAQA